MASRQSIVSQFHIQQAAPSDHDESTIDLNRDQMQSTKDINKVEVDDLGPINAYKYLPLPTQDQFRKQMKVLNIKSCDHVIRYSQMPVPSYADHEQVEMGIYRHLLGIYRAQYLLETFGHRGNIYILENYDPEQWVQLGGAVYGFERLEQIRSGQVYDEQIGEYNYRIRGELIKGFQEIKDYQNLMDFKEQQKKQ